MKTINNVILRILFALVLGVVLIAWPANALNYLVITIGILFIIPGVISILGWLFRNRKEYPDSKFPLEGVGSGLFGLILVLAPRFFVGILMYVLAAMLLLAGILQIVELVRARKWSRVPVGYYIVPVLITICGVIILFYPFKVVETAFIVLGIASLVYGASELLNYLKFRKKTSEESAPFTQIETREEPF